MTGPAEILVHEPSALERVGMALDNAIAAFHTESEDPEPFLQVARSIVEAVSDSQSETQETIADLIDSDSRRRQEISDLMELVADLQCQIAAIRSRGPQNANCVSAHAFTRACSRFGIPGHYSSRKELYQTIKAQIDAGAWPIEEDRANDTANYLVWINGQYAVVVWNTVVNVVVTLFEPKPEVVTRYGEATARLARELVR